VTKKVFLNSHTEKSTKKARLIQNQTGLKIDLLTIHRSYHEPGPPVLDESVVKVSLEKNRNMDFPDLKHVY